MTPFEQGYAAFLRGKAQENNPFDEETCPFSRQRWADGWKKADRDRKEKQI